MHGDATERKTIHGDATERKTMHGDATDRKTIHGDATILPKDSRTVDSLKRWNRLMHLENK